MKTQSIHIIYFHIVIAGLIGFSDIMLANTTAIHMMEDCVNGIDDDGDGFIDINDPDCICEILSQESLIPNPSFEENTCCPVDRSMLDCAVGWIQASTPTTDLVHPCGWVGWDGHFPPFPFPDGEAVVGFANGRLIDVGVLQANWKEYAGACLTSPLKANSTYRFEFDIGFSDALRSPSIDITFFGTTDCSFLPFGVGDADFGCPTNGPNWEKLGSRIVDGGGGAVWERTEITITPDEDIYAIAIGPPCEASTAGRTTYYFFDNLVLADLRSFEFKIAEVNHPCANDFTLSVPQKQGISYQWYMDGIALVGEESGMLSQNYGEGEYQVRLESDGSCLLTESYTYIVPVISAPNVLTICNDEVYQFGDQVLSESGNYNMVFKTQDNCDSMVSLTLRVLPELEESVSAKVFEGETYDEIDNFSFDMPGTYEVALTNSIGCDSMVTLDLDFYNIYIPNVFIPNSDGGNSNFFVAGNEDLEEIKSMLIYDRWGGLVYEQTYDIQNDIVGWNGMYKGKKAAQGIYSYVAVVEMDDGIERQFVGTVLLLE